MLINIKLLVKDQLVDVKWNKSNRKHYEKLGYKYTKNGDHIYVKVEELYAKKETRVKVSCDYCGITYYRQYGEHLKNGEDHCRSCMTKKWHESILEQRQNKLYSDALVACEKSGYTLLSRADEIDCNTTKVKYICPTHGIQEMRISNLINGRHCPQCASDKARERYRMSDEDIIQNISKLGGTLLNVEDYINNQTKNLRVLCPDCNNEFITSFRSFVQHGGQLCKECSSKRESLGERRVRLFLEHNNISYKQNYWFPDCRDIKPLPFDFYLEKQNCIIEFDGSQHYYPSNGHFTRAEDTQKHDIIKNKYCEDNGIRLIRIPYWKYDNIERILSEQLLNPHKDIV